MKKVWIVMKETYLRQVKSWAFVFMVLAPFIFIAMGVGGGLLGAMSAENNLSEQTTIISSNKDLVADVMQLDGYTDRLADEKAAQQALKDEEIAGYLTVEEKDGQLKAVYHADEEMDYSDRLFVSQLLTNYQGKLNQKNAGLSSEQVATLEKEYSLTEDLSKGKSFEKLGQYAAFFGVTVFMYMILITYATQTAQEVAQEKGTKIMEVIFSSVPAPLYFYGKVLGILAVIATHIGIYGIGGFIAYRIAMTYASILGFGDVATSIVGNLSLEILLFVVFGLFIYIVFSALCGSLVARIEDVQKALSPVMILIMVAFFGAMSLGQMGSDNLVLKIASFIPFLSTFFMPIRVINGYATSLESWLSLLILAGTSFALVTFIGKSYAGLILQTDDIGLWKSLKKALLTK